MGLPESGIEGESGITLCQALRRAQEALKRSKVEDAQTDAWYLLEYVTGISRASYLADREKVMEKEQRDAYAALVKERCRRIPLQYLTREQEFMGLSFEVNEDVLIPRQDTETLVEEALSALKERAGESSRDGETLQILDLCTGSGCIAVSIGYLWEQQRKKTPALPDLQVWASDLSEGALLTAEKNARRWGVPVRFFRSDLFADITDAGKGGFDLIVSNPPYIPTEVIGTLADEVKLHEPSSALDGGADGLDFYRAITAQAGARLRPGGVLLFEIGFDQAEDVTGQMRLHGLKDVRTVRDLAGRDRVVKGHV